MADFQIETGRWRGVAREDRVCKECGKREIEDVEHWLLRCEKWKTHRQPLIAMVQEHYGVDQDDLAAVIVYLACRNYKVLSLSLTCGMRDLIELLVQCLEDLWLTLIFVSFMLMYVCSHVWCYTGPIWS